MSSPASNRGSEPVTCTRCGELAEWIEKTRPHGLYGKLAWCQEHFDERVAVGQSQPERYERV